MPSSLWASPKKSLVTVASAPIWKAREWSAFLPLNRCSQVNSGLLKGSFLTTCRKRGLSWSHKQRGQISSNVSASLPIMLCRVETFSGVFVHTWRTLLFSGNLRGVGNGVRVLLQPLDSPSVTGSQYIALTGIPWPEAGTWSSWHRPEAALIPGDSSFQAWFEAVGKLPYKWYFTENKSRQIALW